MKCNYGYILLSQCSVHAIKMIFYEVYELAANQILCGAFLRATIFHQKPTNAGKKMVENIKQTVCLQYIDIQMGVRIGIYIICYERVGVCACLYAWTSLRVLYSYKSLFILILWNFVSHSLFKLKHCFLSKVCVKRLIIHNKHSYILLEKKLLHTTHSEYNIHKYSAKEYNIRLHFLLFFIFISFYGV